MLDDTVCLKYLVQTGRQKCCDSLELNKVATISELAKALSNLTNYQVTAFLF